MSTRPIESPKRRGGTPLEPSRTPVRAALALTGLGCLGLVLYVCTRAPSPMDDVPAVFVSGENLLTAEERPVDAGSSDRFELAFADRFEDGEDIEFGGELANPSRSAKLSKEREFHARFRGLGDVQLASEVRGVLEGDGPRAEKVALLRALLERRHPAAAAACITAATKLPDVSGAWGESVPRTTVRWLRERAAREPLALDILERLAWASDAPAPADLRPAIVSTVVAHASEADLRRLTHALLHEPDPKVRLATWQALAAHPAAEYAGWIQRQLNCDAPRSVSTGPIVE